ncbi:MAG: hypothetical protein MI975_02235 [Cytophagales bacterium]|nr:hypothetical protein [Cytophagales bacterium]
MNKLKPISKQGIPRALQKVERYRLLNNPIEAESICRDILELEPDNQEAIKMLVLTLTDQFGHGVSSNSPNELLPRIKDEFSRIYLKGIILERQAKTSLYRGLPNSQHDAYEWLNEAMEAFQKADELSEDDDDDAILRWNACLRTIEKYHLTARPLQGRELPLE